MGRCEARALALAIAIAVVAPGGTAAAGDWELEIHGGGLFTLPPSSGRVTKPPAGESFQTVAPGVSSLRVTSWYFGDGGTLLQRKQPVTYTYIATSGAYQTVLPLDPVLSTAAVRWPFAVGGGLRVGRRLGRRFTAELNVDYSRHAPEFSGKARADIENGRSSFDRAWSATLSSLPGSRVTSQATVLDGSGRQLVATGVINVNLVTGDAPKWSRRSPRRRFVNYLTLGAGIVSTRGEEANATLVGRYRFASPAGAPFEETDTVTVRSSRTFGTALVGVFGLGWKQDLSTHSGIRFDTRAYVGRNPTRIVMDAQPSVTTGSPAAAFVVNSSIGAIQLVNSRSGYQGQESSLSGPALAGFETFKGTGIQAQLNLTLGVFLRF